MLVITILVPSYGYNVLILHIIIAARLRNMGSVQTPKIDLIEDVLHIPLQTPN